MKHADSGRSLPIIIDTDAGTDDFLAIAYLLAQDVPIEAITVVHGLAHVSDGARNLRGLLELAGRTDVPVYEGEELPLQGGQPFPAEWRLRTDSLPGVMLPQVQANLANPGSAVPFLKRRFTEEQRPVRVLALGPLTNLALALNGVPTPSPCVKEIVIMGGAVEVAGNLAGGNPEEAENDVAEWNIYADPHAADAVLRMDFRRVLVPLDATNDLPITRSFVEDLASHQLTALGRVVAEVLTSSLTLIDSGAYFAWDPLAAVGMLHPRVIECRGAFLEIVKDGKNAGQTRLVRWDDRSSMKVAVKANRTAFESLFSEFLFERF